MKMHVAKSVVDFSALDYVVLEPSISTYNRIETLPTGPDLDAGLQASLADPLWLLARQWQFNEFQGEDAGTPIDSRFAVRGRPVSACFPGGDIATAPQLPVAVSTPIEALIEQEPALARHPRFNAEAGLHLQRMIAHDGPASLGEAVRTAFALTLPAPPDPDSDAPGLLWHVVWGTRAIDAAKLAAALRLLRDASGNITALPPALALPAPDHAAALARLGAWLRWLDDLVMEAPWPNPSWQPDRMEYRFSLGAFNDATPSLRLDAGEYVDGRLDWSSFDARTLTRDPETPPPATTQHAVERRHPTPVRYPGMPADRYWEFEDARVNFAAVEAGPADLTRMMIAEFALAFGNDWFVVPLELEVGALYQVEDFKVVDSFGIEAAVHPSRNSDGTPWRMYELSAGTDAPGPMTDVLFLPPVADRALEGAPLEQLLLVRDEMANLAWGIEKKVQGASGEPIERGLEAARLAMRQQLTLETGDPQLVYRLATHVPAHWIPLLPVRKVRPGASVTEIWLQRAGLKRFYALPDPLAIQPGDDARLRAYKQFLALLDSNDAFIQQTATTEGIGVYLFHPRGRLLLEDEEQPVSDTDSLILCEEEVPRAGAVVRRAFQYARTPDGRACLWLGRAKLTGRGEASSGLKFDTAAHWQAFAN
ncbi:hypothetical protein ACFOLC_14235 [Lysobacter cavernae]|uniref:Uncharacterized protein n=1 Tax=Lysobacter cavernae TaxID=1685901 RepID=A0ABV7RS29_9GAMM